jgi:uncharacterized protein (TIGR03083 family)
MSSQQNIPIDVVHLLPVLDSMLIDLLKSLTPGEWQKQTIAKQWKVKDVAAHLLDGNIRILSIFRDSHWGEQPNIHSREDLINFLNGLNADWVKAMKRVSPQMLISLLEITGSQLCDYFTSIQPFEKSVLAVDWAGETESKNWMEIAREYTEKWLHQQQIRAAVGKPGLMTLELYYPFIDIFMLALPHTYRAISADNGTVVKVTVTSAIGGCWFLERRVDQWLLKKESDIRPTSEIIIDPDTSWKLFSKSLRPEEVMEQIKIDGDQQLAKTALSMISVMA